MPDSDVNVADTLLNPLDVVQLVRTQEIAFQIQNTVYVAQKYVWVKGNFEAYVMIKKIKKRFSKQGHLQNLL